MCRESSQTVYASDSCGRGRGTGQTLIQISIQHLSVSVEVLQGVSLTDS